MNPAAQINRAFARGDIPLHQVPQHQRADALTQQQNRQQAAVLAPGRKELQEMHGFASTPERVALQGRMSGVTAGSPEHAAMQKQYGALPHSDEHAKAIAARRDALRQENDAASAKVTERHTADMAALGQKGALPANYNRGRADATAAYAVNNADWLKFAPHAGALAGGAVGALTADPEKGESALTRGLVGAGLGGAGGLGVQHGLPHAMGYYHSLPR